MTGETPRPVLFDILKHGYAAGNPPPDPFPMGAAGRAVSARYYFADGSFFEVAPTVGGIVVRCITESDHSSLVIQPHDSSRVSILLPVEPWGGEGALHLPGGVLA